MEGRVFLCTWKREPGRFVVWVKRRRGIRAVGETFDEADEALYESILFRTGDGENVREYQPPRPDAVDSDGLLDRFKRIVANGSVRIENLEELWSGGICPRCQLPRGRRTTAPVSVATAPGRADVVAAQAIGFRGPRLQLYSEEFLRLLTPTERRRLVLRAAVSARRSKKVFYEVLSSRIVLPAIAFKEKYVASPLFKCSACGGRNEPSYSFLPPTPGDYVSERSVPRRVPTCFTISRQSGAAICMTADRWRRIAGKPGARQAVSFDVGVVDHRLVDARPRRHEYGEWV